MLAGGFGYALITLAMVVGAHVEEGVVFAVVPFYYLVFVHHEGRCRTRYRRFLIAVLYLGK